MSFRLEAGAPVWASESWRTCHSGGRPCAPAQRGAGRCHTREESLHFWRLQLRPGRRSARAVQRGRRPCTRGHPGERAQREGSGPRAQYPGHGGSGGPGLWRAPPGSVSLQSEVQTLLPAQGRGRGRRVGAEEAGWGSPAGQRSGSDAGRGLPHLADSSQEMKVFHPSLLHVSFSDFQCFLWTYIYINSYTISILKDYLYSFKVFFSFC